MHLKTMAMQITDKNWSVACAVLGASFAAIPTPETVGAFVVINSFSHGGYERRSRGGMIYGSHRVRGNDLALNNFWVSAEEFHAMFDYDKRIKTLQNFFEVTQINDAPIPTDPNVVQYAMQTLNEHFSEEPQD